MSSAWLLDLPSNQKFVLLALADSANDNGVCWPSISTIATKCGMSERSVQAHISALEKMGILTRDERSGRSTIYRIDPRKICTPADSAPPQDLHHTPADSAPTPADSAPHPRKSRTHNHKGTIKEPKGNPKEACMTFGVDELVGMGIKKQHAVDWLTARKQKRSGPPTQTAMDDLAREATKAGLSLAEAVETCAARSWVSLRADWLTNKSQTTKLDRVKAHNEALLASIGRSEAIEGEVIYDAQ